MWLNRLRLLEVTENGVNSLQQPKLVQMISYVHEVILMNLQRDSQKSKDQCKYHVKALWERIAFHLRVP